MIARRQPLAYDLRQIMAALRISTISSASAISARTSPSARVAVVGEQQPKQLMLG
jgi:phosphate transport system protein